MTETNAKRVLEIIRVQTTDKNHWLIYGLTYDTLRLGDRLYLDNPSIHTTNVPVEIIKIVVFDREIEEIGYGYYINLLVTGESGELLKEAKYLHKPTANSQRPIATPMRYLTLDELIFINEQLPDRIHKILKGKQRVRDMGLLEAAVARPTTSAFGQDAYPTPQEKAAALLHSIARNHPFADGNKRTATIAALFMLDVNGLRVTWNPQEALERIMAMAEGRLNVQDLADWLPVEPCYPAPEQEADSDMQRIARIMGEHRWLLDELAQR